MVYGAVARGVLRSSPRPERMSVFCHRRGIELFVACFLHSSAQMCLYQTPGRRPPRITGRFVNVMSKGWVGVPNERAPFRFHGAVVGLSINVCRGLGISPLRINIWLNFSPADLGPTSAQIIFSRFVLIASGTQISWRVSLKFKSFFWQHCVSVVIGPTGKSFRGDEMNVTYQVFHTDTLKSRTYTSVTICRLQGND